MPRLSGARVDTCRTSSSDGDASSERALPAYLRSISSDRAAKQITDRKDPGLRIWRLSPDAVTDYELPGMQRQGDTPAQRALRNVLSERRT